MKLSHRLFTTLLAVIPLAARSGVGYAQTSPVPTTWPALSASEQTQITRDMGRGFGDAPTDPGPLATDLSADLTPDAVVKVVQKVADWELAHTPNYKTVKNWCFGVEDVGLLAASRTTGDPKFHDAMLAMGEGFQWQIGVNAQNPTNADDQCIGQTFLELYLQHHDEKMITPLRTRFDTLMAGPTQLPRGHNNIWWWCDALFMGPPTWTLMYKATDDKKYLDYMNKEYWISSELLYDKEEHLYARDLSFVPKREANGKKVFWSRGNGWVIGGLVRILTNMPKDYPDRPKYVAQFKEMMERIRDLQGPDGLWRAGMLDPDSFVLPENSGSAFFALGMAWGINEGILDRATFQPSLEKAWKGLVSHIYADGRLGCIQQTGSGAAHFNPGSSFNYGVGAFLLAGEEVKKVASTPAK